MKMRKALSFVLVLALVLGSFSMAFAADPIKQGSDLSDIAANANYDAIVANSDLGIITGYEDGTFKPANNVSRAEFAAMITRMMGVPASALGGYSASAFTDMSGYGWANSYVGFCSAKGIVNGYGDGTFGPGNTITVNESITMVLRAIGYVSNSDELVGAWPSNYVTLGKRLGLYDDVTSVATIDRANAAQVIYNALTTVVVAVNADGDTRAAYTYKDSKNNVIEKTVLEVYLDCTPTGWVVYTDKEAGDSVINTLAYVGAYIKAFKNKDGEVVAIAESGSTFLTGKYYVADQVFKAGGVKYNLKKADENNAATKYTPDGEKDAVEAKLFANSIQATADDGTIDMIAEKDGDGNRISYTLGVKLSGKTIKEVYSVNQWAPVDTFKFEADMLDKDTLNGYNFVLDDNDQIDNDRLTLLGVTALDKIAEDNVVKVYLKDNANPKSDIVRVTVGTEIVKGKITLDDDGDYTIGGKVYSGNSEDDIAVGDTGTAYLDYDGDIAFWDVENADSDNFAMVTGSLIQGTRDYTVILFDKAGNEKEYVVKSDAKLIDTDGKAFDDFDAAKLAIVEDTLVTFGLDKNGKITKLTLLGKYAVNADGADFDGVNVDQLSATRTVYGNDRVDSSVVVFAMNGAADYSVVSLNDVKTKKDLTGTATYKGDNGRIKVMIITKEFAGADSVYAVLNLVKTAYNSDDDKVQLAKGFASGTAFNAYTDGENTFGTPGDYVLTDVSAVKAPVIAALSVNSKGVITKVEATDKVTAAKKGYVITKSGRDLGLNDDATLDADKYAAIADKAAVYVFDKSDGEFSLATWSSIKAKTAADGSFVYIYEIDDDVEGYDIVVVIQD